PRTALRAFLRWPAFREGPAVREGSISSWSDNLVALPALVHRREILALVRAARFGAREGGTGHDLGDARHDVEVQPVEHRAVERSAGRRAQTCQFITKRLN